jgi:hypothetical protein
MLQKNIILPSYEITIRHTYLTQISVSTEMLCYKSRKINSEKKLHFNVFYL